MPLPVVAIVGRPNVGKSSLFNWLAGRRIAIVDPTAGVTRDRVSTLVQIEDRWFELMDTGGIGIHDADHLEDDVERQIAVAIDQADAILFVVDGRDGPVPLDEEVARRLRPVGKPVLCVVNKCDTPALAGQVGEFYRLGHGEPIPVSAHQKIGLEAIFRRLLPVLPAGDGTAAPEGATLKLAIVGRRNTGKSTFINQLARTDRMIVSETPGTTRDSVDVRFERDGKAIVAIDTAGVRRKRSVKGDIEFYSLARAERSIRRADVVLLFFDAARKVSMVDKKLAEYVLEQHKPVIFVVNKWDLLRPMPTGNFADYLKATFPMLDFVPMVFITAKTGRNVHPLVNLAQHLMKQAGARVSTAEINRVLRHALTQQAPPLQQNRRPKIYYGTQVATHPPTIVLFTNGPELFADSYRRYLLKTFRDHLPFSEVPIKLYLRNRPRNEPDQDQAEPVEKPLREKSKRRRGKPSRIPQADQAQLWDDL
jgi:GTP-binding protein